VLHRFVWRSGPARPRRTEARAGRAMRADT
jgi:hypothetical protein